MQRALKRLSAWLGSPSGQRVLNALKVVGTALVLGFLVYQLSRIGWRQVLASLPTNPWFYVIFVLLYVNLPLMESVIYGRVLRVPFAKLIGPLIKKRVYNRDLVDYSGDVAFFGWIEKETARPRMEVLHIVKDNAIVSAMASISYAVVFLWATISAGLLTLPSGVGEGRLPQVVGGIAVLVLAAVLIVRFRRSVFLLAPGVLGWIFGVHFVRMALVSFLQVLQWWIVLPDFGFSALLTIHALQVVAVRIPLLPSRELLFVGASIELARLLEVSMAGMAGVLVAAAALDKVVNLTLFGLVSALEARARRSTRSDSGQDSGVRG